VVNLLNYERELQALEGQEGCNPVKIRLKFIENPQKCDTVLTVSSFVDGNDTGIVACEVVRVKLTRKREKLFIH
jgi:hypothetical protein